MSWATEFNQNKSSRFFILHLFALWAISLFSHLFGQTSSLLFLSLLTEPFHSLQLEKHWKLESKNILPYLQDFKLLIFILDVCLNIFMSPPFSDSTRYLKKTLSLYQYFKFLTVPNCHFQLLITYTSLLNLSWNSVWKSS